MKSSSACFVLLQAWLVTAQTRSSTNENYFQQIKETNKDELESDTLFIRQEFFSCDRKQSCTYLVKKKRNRNYEAAAGNDVIDAEDNFDAIWKKRNLGCVSCAEAYNKGSKTSKEYQIILPNSDIIVVRCDMETDGGGWIVFQRRVDNTVDFFRNWTEYRRGFGDLNCNFWLGLEKIHQLAGPGKKATLRVDIKHMDFSSIKFAKYTTFEIADESDDYRLTIGGYTGDAGDALAFHNGMKFTTKDRDNDNKGQNNCAKQYNGAWWYENCHHSNLNGLYPPNDLHSTAYMSWSALAQSNGRVTFSEMKMKHAY